MSSRGRNRPRSFFSSNFHKKKKMDLFFRPGMKGFICTCNNGNERPCIKDAYNILHEYGDRLLEEEVMESDSKATVNGQGDSKLKEKVEDEDDEMDEFKKEVDALKSQRQGGNSRFRAVDTGVTNCMFIETTLPDPVGLADTIMRDIAEKKQLKARFLLRILPIETTCKADIDDILENAAPLIDKYFRTDPVTYAIQFTRRCSSSVDRDTMISKLADMIQKCNNEHKVNLTNPTLSVIVEAMKGLCGLSVVRDYCQLAKYNLRQLCGLPLNDPGPAKKQDESTSKPGQDSDDTAATNSTSSVTEGSVQVPVDTVAASAASGIEKSVDVQSKEG